MYLTVADLGSFVVVGESFEMSAPRQNVLSCLPPSMLGLYNCASDDGMLKTRLPLDDLNGLTLAEFTAALPVPPGEWSPDTEETKKNAIAEAATQVVKLIPAAIHTVHNVGKTVMGAFRVSDFPEMEPSLVTPQHCDVFLRLQLCGAQIPHAVIRDLTRFAVMNDCDAVFAAHMRALQLLFAEMEGGHTSKHSSRTASKTDEPSLLPQVRRSIPPFPSAADVPRFFISQCHFKFVLEDSNGLRPEAEVDPGAATKIFEGSRSSHGSDDAVTDKPRYFSAQVRIKNESKPHLAVAITQRKSDTVGDADEHDIDFQVLMDKSVIKKGEVATLLLSIILKPGAYFSTIRETVIVTVDDLVKVPITFALINPHGSVFGSGFPMLVTSRLVCPLGTVNAPKILLLLRSFISHCTGNYAKPVYLGVLESIARTTDPTALLREVISLRSALEDADVSTLREFDNTHWPRCLSDASVNSALSIALLHCWLCDARVIGDEEEAQILAAAASHETAIEYFLSCEPFKQGIFTVLIDILCRLLRKQRVNGCTIDKLAAAFAVSLCNGGEPCAMPPSESIVFESGEVNPEDISMPPRTRTLLASVALCNSMARVLAHWIEVADSKYSGTMVSLSKVVPGAN